MDNGDAGPGDEGDQVSYLPLCMTLADGLSTVTDNDDGTGDQLRTSEGAAEGTRGEYAPLSFRRDS